MNHHKTTVTSVIYYNYYQVHYYIPTVDSIVVSLTFPISSFSSLLQLQLLLIVIIFKVSSSPQLMQLQHVWLLKDHQISPFFLISQHMYYHSIIFPGWVDTQQYY